MKDFEKFKKYFMEYARQFGIDKEYDIYFDRKKLESWASISADSEGCWATISFSTEKPSKFHVSNGYNLKETAKHEAIHLLLFRYRNLAYNRFAGEEELYREFERITTVLSKVFK